jgi:hypothetical protein
MCAEITIRNDVVLHISEGEAILQSLDDKLLSDKIDAFCYYKLNNFEMALKQNNDKAAMDCWEEYLVYLYTRSTAFYKIIQSILKTDYGKIYNQDFVKRIKKTLEKKDCIV